MKVDAASVIALLAFLLAILTYVSTQNSMKRSEKVSGFAVCRQRVKDLEAKLARTEERIKTIEEENLHLMRRLLKED